MFHVAGSRLQSPRPPNSDCARVRRVQAFGRGRSNRHVDGVRTHFTSFTLRRSGDRSRGRVCKRAG
jgi:hypothetical protein